MISKKTKGVSVNAKAMTSITMYFLLVCSLVLVSGADIQADSFQAGSMRFSLVAGSGRSFDDNYAVVGMGVGYFVVDGLEVGLDGEAWFGGDPDIYKLSPQVKYVLPLQSKIRPYAGAFYRRTFLDGLDDQNSVGARGGIYFISSPNMSFGVGAVYESYLDCDDSVGTSCDTFYPEITFAFSF